MKFDVYYSLKGFFTREPVVTVEADDVREAEQKFDEIVSAETVGEIHAIVPRPVFELFDTLTVCRDTMRHAGVRYPFWDDAISLDAPEFVPTGCLLRVVPTDGRAPFAAIDVKCVRG
jgi:hypothetical protein